MITDLFLFLRLHNLILKTVFWKTENANKHDYFSKKKNSFILLAEWNAVVDRVEYFDNILLYGIVGYLRSVVGI
jgi:hypothetical protein